ncbi:hypothetical protein DL96DRAFT_1781056 [Flagelloscypha sp. PMI_526]|nr:hypothetical protein DL96DRAFT_1781056 [Flagelloscypha sp. PMI_526]
MYCLANMLQFILPLLLSFSMLANAGPLRVRFNPTVTQVEHEPDWGDWAFVNGASSETTTMSGVTATVSSSTTFTGSYWAIGYRGFEAYLGQRVEAEGISAGTTGSVDISVNGEVVLSNVTQTIRQDNVWISGSSYLKFRPDQKVTVKYMPQSGTAATDKRVFLNGFEIDTGNMKEQASFQYPVPWVFQESFMRINFPYQFNDKLPFELIRVPYTLTIHLHLPFHVCLWQNGTRNPLANGNWVHIIQLFILSIFTTTPLYTQKLVNIFPLSSPFYA